MVARKEALEAKLDTSLTKQEEMTTLEQFNFYFYTQKKVNVPLTLATVGTIV